MIMNKNEAKKQIEKLRDEINYHNHKYYVENNPVISDYEFDRLLKRLEALEAQYPDLITPDSPTQRVGGEPLEGFVTVEHKVAMLSLDNTYTYDELREFDERIKKNVGSVEYIVEPKIDGVGVALLYENGIFVRGTTRGDGVRGDDITSNLRTIHSIPLKLRGNALKNVEVRGEVYIPLSDFRKLNREQVKKGDVLFARRNAYLKRASFVNFEGICSGDALVIRPKIEKIANRYLSGSRDLSGDWHLSLTLTVTFNPSFSNVSIRCFTSFSIFTHRVVPMSATICFSFFISKVQIFGSFIRAALIFMAIVSSVSGVVEAAGIPRTLSYQGVLTDGAGMVVPDGSYSLTFRIYDVESGGIELWKEDHGSVQVQKGIFNVILGSINSLDLDFDVPYWLGISVEGEKELEPRIPLVSSPYSMNAVMIKGTNVFPGSGNVGVGTTTPLEALDVNGGVRIGNTGSTNAGTIRWTGTDFEGYDGSSWKSLTATGGGSLPPGSAGQTLRHDGSSWIATSSLYNNGTNVGIGTTAPQSKLHVRQDSDGATGIIIENGDTGSNSVEELIFANEDGSLAGVRLYDDGGAYPSRMRIFNSRPNAALLLTNNVGSIEIDSVGATAINSNGGIYKFRGAEFKALRGSSDTPFMRFYGGSNGGIFSLYDEKGNNLGSIEADLDGEGGWMGVASDENYNNGIYLDGNYWGSLEPVLTIDGPSGSGKGTIVQKLKGVSLVLMSTLLSFGEMVDKIGRNYHTDLLERSQENPSASVF